jgi:hypothetical protein
VSEVHLFTGHEDGGMFMWRLTINKNLRMYNEDFEYINNNHQEEIVLDPYRLAYNKDYYNTYVDKPFKLKYKFDDMFEFHTKKSIPLRLLKLTEDASMMIAVLDDMSLCYWNYTDFFAKKQSKKSSSKTCPQCNGKLGSSSNNCSLCNKKICGQCKNVVK